MQDFENIPFYRNVLPLVFLVPFLVSFSFTPSWTSYPIVLLIGFMCKTEFSFRGQNGLVGAILFILLSSIFRYNQYSINMLKDLGLMSIGIMPFLLNSQFYVDIKRLNIWLFYGFFIAAGASLAGFRFDSEAFINSSFGIELGALCYTYSLLAIYWFQKGEKSWFILNCILTVLSGKRIAFVSVIACVIIHSFFRNKDGVISSWLKFLIILFAVVYLFFTFFFTYGFLDDYIYDLTGKSADSFTMGRQQLYAITFSMLDLPNLWGLGPGNTVETIKTLYGVGGRMHNDYLKIFAENGAILYPVFFFILLRKLEYKQLPTMCFILAVFLTTNTFIYVYMLFLYGVFLDSDKYFYYNNDSTPIFLQLFRVIKWND